MDEYYSDNQPQLIHCDHCGEEYAATYRVCPFCHGGRQPGKSSGRSGGSRSSGRGAGNRVRTNTRGGGYGGSRSPLSIIGIVLAVTLIIAAVIIIVVLAKSVFGGEKNPTGTTPGSSVTSQEDTQGNEDEPGSQIVAPDGVSLDQPAMSLTPGVSGSLVVTIDPVNWIGQVIWSTSDAAVATVDQNGVVTYVGEGSCIITASAAGVSASCTVTCTQPSVVDPSEATIVVDCYGWESDDFTLSVDETIPLTVKGGDGVNYTFEMEDTSIATVDREGKVTGWKKGKTTLRITSGTETVEIIIRVKD